MKTTRLALPALAGCMVLFVPSTVQATTGWMIAWLNNYPERCQELKDAAQSCTLCHGAGSSLNDYAKDMTNLNFAVIEDVDSDGDGRTNGQEILEDCTLPGDADSVPEKSDSWGAIKVQYR